MSDNKNKKYVYLVGNDKVGFQAYSYDKTMVKNYLKQYPHLTFKKVKNTSKLQTVLFSNHEIFEFFEGSFLTESEEEFFVESLGQLITDVQYNISSFKDHISCLKLTEEEKECIKSFIIFLYKLFEAYENCESENDNMELFDHGKAFKYFAKNVLGVNYG